MWVANRNGRSVTKLRAFDGRTVGTFRVGRRPLGIIAHQGSIWVTNNDDRTVTKLRATDGAQLGTYRVGDGPFGIAADGSSIWVTNFFDSTLMRLSADDGAVLGRLEVGDSPASIIYEAGLLAISNTGDDSVTILRPNPIGSRDRGFDDPATVVTTLTGVSRPFGLAVTRTAATATLWVASFTADAVVPLQAPAGLFMPRR
jgi:hypothetical protein